MTRLTTILTATTVCAAIFVTTAYAQWVVYDPTNYAEAVAEFEQLVQQYQFLLAQARRLPIDMASRYRGYSSDWTRHDAAGFLFAQPLVTALNQGDTIGAISGLAQFNTRSGFDYSFTDAYRQAAGASLATSTSRVLDRYLNVLPTITIREGFRIKVYLTNDMELPVYEPEKESAQ